MEQKKARYIIPRGDIAMSDAMQFSQHFEVRLPFSIEKVEDLGASLQNCYTMLKAGDLLNVCAYENAKYERLTEVATFRVVSCNAKRIETYQISDVVKIPAQAPEDSPTAHINLEIVKTGNAF